MSLEQTQKYLVYGYCNSVESSLKLNDKNIPIEIIELILCFYNDDYKFYVKQHGDNLEFTDKNIFIMECMCFW